MAVIDWWNGPLTLVVIFFALCLLLLTWSIAGVACRACHSSGTFFHCDTHTHTHTHTHTVRIPSRGMGTFFLHSVGSTFRLSLTHTHTRTHTHIHIHTNAHTHTCTQAFTRIHVAIQNSIFDHWSWRKWRSQRKKMQESYDQHSQDFFSKNNNNDNRAVTRMHFSAAVNARQDVRVRSWLNRQPLTFFGLSLYALPKFLTVSCYSFDAA